MNAAGATRPLPGAAQERTPVPSRPLPPQQRRVREEAKDGLAVIAFSAAASIGLALLFVLLAALAT